MGDSSPPDDSIASAPASRADGALAERMDAASRTAAALAHQLANYLGTTRAMLELLAERVKGDSGAARDLEVLEESVAGTMRFLDALRAFTHPSSLGAGACDVNAVLHEAEPELRGALRSGARLTLRLAPGRLDVRGDAARVRRLALDLVAAAASGRSGGGDVVIETGPGPDARAGPSGAQLVVHAAALAFEPAQAARILEPFVFDPSYDGGLRLPALYATVARSGGSLVVEASPAGGTALRVSLPREATVRDGREAAQ